MWKDESRAFGENQSTSNRVVVIIGASGGIGRALLDSYRGEGVALYLVAHNGYEALATFAYDATARGDYPFLRVYRADLAEPDVSLQLAQSIQNNVKLDFGEQVCIDELALCAGVDLMVPERRELTFAERLRHALQIDVESTIVIARALGRFMRDHRRARGLDGRDGGLLFFSWDGVERGRSGETSELYAACKGAISGYARSLAQSLSPAVRVNTIAPGWISTRWGTSAPSPIRARLSCDSLAQRWGEPSEIVSLARFLLSSNASYVNAQTVEANGGYAYSGADRSS